ncbi:hypothetical protein C0585_00470 [Candidatus Woesearchaeota archaeon]|nr:MAG: hypothetical protein C0585_00470 [Candidatus Woesearchaeota archaeon]
MDKLNELISRYDLPSLGDFEKDFGRVEKVDNYILSEFRKKIAEKIDYFISILESLVQPDNNLSGIYESRYLSDEQRQELFGIFRILMSYSRKSSSLSTSYDEEKEAEFIKDFYNEWQSIKPIMENYLFLLSDMWKKEINSDDIKENYMG